MQIPESIRLLGIAIVPVDCILPSKVAEIVLVGAGVVTSLRAKPITRNASIGVVSKQNISANIRGDARFPGGLRYRCLAVSCGKTRKGTYEFQAILLSH